MRRVQNGVRGVRMAWRLRSWVSTIPTVFTSSSVLAALTACGDPGGAPDVLPDVLPHGTPWRALMRCASLYNERCIVVSVPSAVECAAGVSVRALGVKA